MQGKMVEKCRRGKTFGKGLLVLLLLGAMVIPPVGAVASANKMQDELTLLDPDAGYLQKPGLSSGTPLLSQTGVLGGFPEDMFFSVQSSGPDATVYGSKTGPFAFRVPATSKPLVNGVTATGILNATDESDIWYLNVTTGARSMWAVLTCPYETDRYTDFDLYGRRGAYPTNTSFDWAATASGSDEIEITNPGAGTWYILVFSWRGKGTYQLTVTTLYARNVKPFTIGTVVSGNLNATADSDLWYIDIGNGTGSMRAVLTCPSGADFDLYGKWGSYPTTSNYTWRGCAGGSEDVSYATPKAGRWYIMPYSYHGNGTYQLTVTTGYPASSSSDTIFVFLFLIIGATLFLIFVGIAFNRRGTADSSLTGGARRAIYVSGAEASAELERKQERVSARHELQCARCGASLEVGASYCWNCGAAAKAGLTASTDASQQTGQRVRSGICMVCKNGLEKSDEMLFCPYCGSLAHKEHLLEWLHVKDHCPSCGRHLDEGEVQKQIEE